MRNTLLTLAAIALLLSFNPLHTQAQTNKPDDQNTPRYEVGGQLYWVGNSDVSDGWEREGENEVYFKKYSEKIAYPLGINIIFYLMTH